MIPPFNEFGYLPPGVYPAALDEIDARFGQASELRRVQMESVRWMVELAIKAGVQRIILNGSFVTDIIEPADVDCVLLIGQGFPKDSDDETNFARGFRSSTSKSCVASALIGLSINFSRRTAITC
jgi:hypothetical protein